MGAMARSALLWPNSTSGMEAMRDLRREDASGCCICCDGGGGGDPVVELASGTSFTDIVVGINTWF